MSALKRVRERIKTLKQVPSRVSDRYARVIEAEVLRAFDSQRRVNGAAWAPPTKASIDMGWVPPLGVESGALRGTIQVYPLAGSGIRIEVGGLNYMRWFLKGRTGQVARPLLPPKVPAAWRNTLRDLVREEWSF